MKADSGDRSGNGTNRSPVSLLRYVAMTRSTTCSASISMPTHGIPCAQQEEDQITSILHPVNRWKPRARQPCDQTDMTFCEIAGPTRWDALPCRPRGLLPGTPLPLIAPVFTSTPVGTPSPGPPSTGLSVCFCSSHHPWALSFVVVLSHETTILILVGWNRTFFI